MARYIPHLADYNYTLVHLPGTSNKADGLSRHPNFAFPGADNTEITVLPPSVFACASTLSFIDDRVRSHQLTSLPLLTWWTSTYALTCTDDLF